MRFRLGDVTFDGEQRLLLRGHDPVALSPEARHLLEFLIEKSPRAVSTKELQRVVWSDDTVPEWSLLALVSELRRALGDDQAEPRFIRTVQGFGYAFEGGEVDASPVDQPRVARRHRLVRDGREIPLEEGENILGRDPGCVRIEDGTVSRRHARITITDGAATLEDLGSKNGTWWLEDRLGAVLSLSDGDEFTLGSVKLVYRGPGSGLEEADARVVPTIQGVSIGGGDRERSIAHPEVTLDLFLARPVGPPAARSPLELAFEAPETPVPAVQREERRDDEAPDPEEPLAGRFE